MSISDPDHMPPTQGLPQQRPLLTTSVVIYATLALLAVTIPRGLVNWVKNFEPNASQQVALQIADAIAGVSQRIGADRAFGEAREWFLRVTGKRED